MGNDNSHLRSYGGHYAHTPVPKNTYRWGGCLGCLNEPEVKKTSADSESHTTHNPVSEEKVRQLLRQDLAKRDSEKQSFLNPLQRLRASHVYHTRNTSEPGLTGLSEQDLIQAAPVFHAQHSIRPNLLKVATDA